MYICIYDTYISHYYELLSHSPTQVDLNSAPPPTTPTPATPPPPSPAHYDVVVVACGNRQPETVVLMKSALLFTRVHIVFHIFTEKLLMPAFRSQVGVCVCLLHLY